ncbi:hypothetical protein ACE6H2_020660 [Prunus campanulata]
MCPRLIGTSRNDQIEILRSWTPRGPELTFGDFIAFESRVNSKSCPLRGKLIWAPGHQVTRRRDLQRVQLAQSIFIKVSMDILLPSVRSACLTLPHELQGRPDREVRDCGSG